MNIKLKAGGFIASTLSKSQLLVVLLVAFISNGCGSQSDTSVDSSLADDNVLFSIPESIMGAKLDQTAGNLTATISVNGGSPMPMTISESGTTASTTLNNIPVGETSFTIVFTYDLDPFGPLVVASATQSMTVTEEGTNTITFASDDYDSDSFDADGDGLSNLKELAESSTTSPVSCTLGVGARLGTCELRT
jgi:hypothetical protein